METEVIYLKLEQEVNGRNLYQGQDAGSDLNRLIKRISIFSYSISWDLDINWYCFLL